MTLDHEALHNRIRQNQAYNDHIVQQQNDIVKRFDKVGSLEESVRQIQVQADIVQHAHEDLEDHSEHVDLEILAIKDDLLHLGDFYSDLMRFVEDFKSTYQKAIPEIFQSIKELKDDLESFKDRYLKDFVQFDKDFENYKNKNHADINNQFVELNKQIPETPPYIQDLRDTITHKIRIFEIEVGKAVDKANHAEMLYKVLEKRTRP